MLFVIGLFAAWLTDRLYAPAQGDRKASCRELVVHEDADCGPASWRQIAGYWKQCTPARGILAAGLLLFIVAVASGQLGPKEWNWIRVTLILVSTFTLFVVVTVPDHFLEQHLWDHVARKHAPRIFVWTFGALLLTHSFSSHVGVATWIQDNPMLLLILACVLGIIPDSGPHLLFVTLFAEGAIPFSILLASSIVQDGHGMLPLLGESLRAFVAVKAINLVVGLLVGLAVLLCGC